MTLLLPGMVLLPLLGAVALILLAARAPLPGSEAEGRTGAEPPARAPGARTVLPATLLAVVAGAVTVLVAVAGGPPRSVPVAGWPAGVAIPLVADTFAALMLVTTSALTLVCALFALASGEADRRWFAPLVLVLVAGVNGALLTGDLFTFFVMLEIMLLPSYGLALLARHAGGPRERIDRGRVFVLVSLLTSAVLLAGIGFTYGVSGTVVIAELAGAAVESGPLAAAVAVVLFAVTVKAAVVPFHGWLARAYPGASPAVTALFSGLHTKVAVYMLYRLYAVVFDGDARWLWIGLIVFTVTMVVGVLGAVGESTTRSILTFHMVSQLGYILLGLALFSPLGLTAGIFYLLHNMIAKSSLFLTTGAVEARYGTYELGEVRGIARREPFVAAAFLLGAFALAGLPPLSGFVGKLSLVMASLEVGQILVAVMVVLVSLGTLLSMLKIWTNLFGGPEHVPNEPDPDPHDYGQVPVLRRTDRRISAGLLAPGLALALTTVVLGFAAEPLLALCREAAEQLLDPAGYAAAVLGEAVLPEAVR